MNVELSERERAVIKDALRILLRKLEQEQGLVMSDCHENAIVEVNDLIRKIWDDIQ